MRRQAVHHHGRRRADCRWDFHFRIERFKPGDVVIVSGPVGDHGITIWSTREGIDFAGYLKSDTAPLHALVEAMIESGRHPRSARPHARRSCHVSVRDRSVLLDWDRV